VTHASPPAYVAPASGEVEVNVFGPGVGGCIVVHLGAGKWIVVDSCQGRGSKIPAALQYLEAIGVDAATDITHVVATHWHDDHVKGIAAVYTAATSAHFYAASSVRPDEFLAVTRAGPMGSRFSSGVQELSLVAKIADERGVPVRAVSAAQRIHHDPTMPVSEVWALSPSFQDLSISRSHIAAMLPVLQQGSRRLPSLPPNDTSVAGCKSSCGLVRAWRGR